MIEHDSELGIRHSAPRLIIRFEGELDLSRVDELDGALTPAASLDGLDLTVDLTAVTFVDSTAVMWLLRTQEDLGHRNGRLGVVATPEAGIVRLLALTGVQDLIKVDLLPTAAELPQPSDMLFPTLDEDSSRQPVKVPTIGGWIRQA